jgi:Uncharacterized conserved protein
MAGQHESVELVGDRTAQHFAVAVLVAALTAAFAQVTVPYPLSPAPFTLQTAGVYLAGLLLGPVWGAFSLVLYLLVGVAGAPVFAGGSAGYGVLVGPTGGYIVSFPVAAALIGGLVHRRVEPRRLDGVSVLLQAAAVLLGLAVVYLVGSAWLAAQLGLPLANALVQGGVVFVPGDVGKAVAVIALATGGHLARSRGVVG